MAVMQCPAERSLRRALLGTQDLGSTPEAAFALVCEVEKWPVWLSFLHSARRLEPDPLSLGSEVVVRSAIPGDEEELYEVDRYIEGHAVSLVGAYSIRRRIDFRVERKNARSKLVVRVDYPSYGGTVGALIDRMTARRRLESKLADSMLHFKGLVEFPGRDESEPLSDF